MMSRPVVASVCRGRAGLVRSQHVLGTKDLTLDRLYQRHEESQKKGGGLGKLCKALAGCMAPIVYSPLALNKVLRIAGVNNEGTRRKFYCHAICNLDRLKELGTERGTGTLTTTLTASILEAFFAGTRGVASTCTAESCSAVASCAWRESLEMRRRIP